MLFAKRVYTIAGVYGVLVLLPMYFMEDRIGRETPPAITHPEYFYGFVGAALAWQLVYLVIGRDPARFRPLMPVSWFAKCGFGVTAWTLCALHRTPVEVAALASVDLIWMALFMLAWRWTSAAGTGSPSRP